MGFGGHSMPVAIKITVALKFGSFQGSTGDMCGASQAAAHHCVKEVTNALFKRADNNVHSEIDPDSQAERALGFRVITGFPQVQGVINCTHMAIKAPMNQSASFINRKGFHSINVKSVCDHQKGFRQVCAHFSGSSHVAYIFRLSQVPQLFRSPHSPSGMDSRGQWLPIEYMPTGACGEILQCSRGEIQHLSQLHQATIEQAIGLSKMRFHCLDRSGGALHYAPVRVSRIFVQSTADHNPALQRG
ncbi:putative nuclease HARBI1 [Heterodontus francisci]|uniref:putative nuclease HARBI1 n=1 Tax=Heterodontus francisci TaxID=7792 RepID=UPI00355C86F5